MDAQQWNVRQTAELDFGVTLPSRTPIVCEPVSGCTHRYNNDNTHATSYNSPKQTGLANFYEGEISGRLRAIQELCLRSYSSQRTITLWMKGFIECLLNINDSQWICRNITKHHRSLEKIALVTRQDILTEVGCQLGLGVDSYPPRVAT